MSSVAGRKSSKMRLTGGHWLSKGERLAVLAHTYSFWPTCSLGPGAAGWKEGRAGCGFFQALIYCLMQAEKKEEAHR